MQNFLRTLLFLVFFAVGASALSLSVLVNDLVSYYRDKGLLSRAQRSLKRLESLNADYDALLARLHQDPNLVSRIAPAMLGTAPADQNAVYPKVRAEQLAAARKALTEGLTKSPPEPRIPVWLSRCSEPRRRMLLFFCGAALILISFSCFGSTRSINKHTDEDQGAKQL